MSFVCLSTFSVYRLQLLEKLSQQHIDCLRQAADEMIGTEYDYGQALDLFVGTILG
ncbi:hypothetical protein JW960_29070 [candidate division KSB1 bacterium]|nr:hypothetical protein [candidate division KSB1 bacterium]